jgi:hypothetical protein
MEVKGDGEDGELGRDQEVHQHREPTGVGNAMRGKIEESV